MRPGIARASQEIIVRVIACLAAGLGIRGTARVFENNPNTVLQWLVEATEPLPEAWVEVARVRP